MRCLSGLLLLQASLATCTLAALVNKRQDTVETLSDDTINLIKARLAESAEGSWENGTRAEALLEYDYPMLAVFYNPAIPLVPGRVPADVNAIAQYTIQNKPSDTLMFCADSSAGDPASLGVSILLANATINEVDYMPAVNEENDWLLYHAPRTFDGAVSQRVDQVQLWSDFVAMVPPYLAYYGAITGNGSFLQAAYDQCRLYRQYMNNGTGLWQHIILGTPGTQDPGFWATGNAWAAWGMLRVMVTMMHTRSFSDVMETQKADLQSWIVEILKASYASADANTGLLPNYLQEQTFGDASSTALMASVSYRLAQLNLDTSTLADADNARHAVFGGVDTTTGWLSPVVDPRDWSRQGSNSPEGQAFTLLLAASYRDYNNATGKSAPTPSARPSATATATPTAAAPRSLEVSILAVLATCLLSLAVASIS